MTKSLFLNKKSIRLNTYTWDFKILFLMFLINFAASIFTKVQLLMEGF